MNPRKLTAIYGRVSSSNQENEGTIETQLSAVLNYAANNGLEIVKKYLDEGWSGDSIVRPALDQLRVDAKKGLWDAVLMYDPDRLARRYSYQELITDELREAGIQVMFVTTPTPKDGVEKILFGVQGLFAEYERAKISERFRLGKVRKAKEGHIISSEGPYGYTFVVKNGKKGDPNFRQGYYTIDEEEARTVRDMFSWVGNDGLTLRKVVTRLKELEIKPRKSARGVWNTSTLSKLFRNKTYIGEGHFGASYAVVPTNPLKKDIYRKIKKSSRRNKPENEWITIPTPKLIDKDLFQRVQVQLKNNFDHSNRNKKNKYLLSGLIWCSCGNRRTGEGPQHGKYLYYRCSNRIYSFPLPPTCREKGINAVMLDDLLWERLAEMITSPELIEAQVKRLSQRKIKEVPSDTITERIKKEVAKLIDQEKRYIKAFGVGAITLEQLQVLSGSLKEQIQAHNYKIAHAESIAQQNDRIIIPEPSEIEGFVNRISNNIQDLNFDQKKAIISNIVYKITGTNEGLQIQGSIPIGNVDLFSNYRNGGSTNRYSELKKIPFNIELKVQKN
jgi:site-specific DNA recombinase